MTKNPNIPKWCYLDDHKGNVLKPKDVCVHWHPSGETMIVIVESIYSGPGTGDSQYPITINYACCKSGRSKAHSLLIIGRL